MARMVRKQFYIDVAQDKKLKALSKKLGVTEAELVRRAIDGLNASPTDRRNFDLATETLDKLARRHIPSHETLGWSRSDIYRDRPRLLDAEAWSEELAFIEERERLLPQGGSTEKWRREDSARAP